MASDSRFTPTQLEGIAREIGRLDFVLSMTVLERKVAEIGIETQLDVNQSKWRYLLDAFESWQGTTGSSTNVLKFIELVATHVLYTGTSEQSIQLTGGLNRILNRCGYFLSEDGTVGAVEPGQPASMVKQPLVSPPKQSDTPFPSHNTPVAIRESVAKFQRGHPHGDRTGFIIMRFGKERPLLDITEAIKKTLSAHGLTAVRADERSFSDYLLHNVETYMHGCGFGIAVFERFRSDTHNANIAFEVGYMRALGKNVCLLRDDTMASLQSDLLGQIDVRFDPSNIAASIPEALDKWLRDKGLLS